MEGLKGKTIRIVRMDGEPQYAGKTGVIEQIGRDCEGLEYWRGTWGGCSVYPHLDTVEFLGDRTVA